MQTDVEERILAVLERLEARLAHEDDRTGKTGPPKPPGNGSGEEAAPTIVRAGGNEEEDWLDLPEEQVASILSPFANEQRLKLLKALYLGFSESGQLKEFSGLTGGQLYHHLKELALAKFLSRQERGEYRLSSFGYYAFSSLMILAADLLTEQEGQEQVGPEEIGELE